MKPTLETQIISSLYLCIDHVLQQQGAAYQNYSSRFYPVKSDIAGYTAYAAPFKQLCNDTSVSGAQVISGLYINGAYTPIGSGGLAAINHYKGLAYFSTPPAANATVSGNYSIKEFNVEIADQPEWKLMFESKYVPNNFYSHVLTGVSPSDKTSPIVYLVVKNQKNVPFGFSHIDNETMRVRAVVIADNEFQSIGATSLMKDLFSLYLPILTGLPFDSQGNCTGINYNYKTTPQDTVNRSLIREAEAVDISQKGDFKDIPKNLAMVDFTIETIRQNAGSIA